MKSSDHDAILPLGLHQLSLPELHALAIEPFGSARRDQLWKGFCALVQHLHEANLYSLELWIDGEIMTKHPAPLHVSAVLWLPPEHVARCTETDRSHLLQLLDYPKVLYKFSVKLFAAMDGSTEDRDYWESELARSADGFTHKGIAVLTL